MELSKEEPPKKPEKCRSHRSLVPSGPHQNPFPGTPSPETSTASSRALRIWRQTCKDGNVKRTRPPEGRLQQVARGDGTSNPPRSSTLVRTDPEGRDRSTFSPRTTLTCRAEAGRRTVSPSGPKEPATVCISRPLRRGPGAVSPFGSTPGGLLWSPAPP